MTRIMITGLILAVSTPVLADTGSDWFHALQKRNAKAALKVTVTSDLKYGKSGEDKTIKTNIKRLYNKAFTKLRRSFKQASMESKTCTEAARELGYMSQEWRDKDRELGIWISRINNRFCTGEGMFSPRVWLAQIMVKDMPHAIVIYDTGGDKLIDGFYHF